MPLGHIDHPMKCFELYIETFLNDMTNTSVLVSRKLKETILTGKSSTP